MPNYGDNNYWENRYLEQKDSVFDWLEDFESLRGIFEDLFRGNVNAGISSQKDKAVPFNGTILMLGCGNSELSEKLYEKMSVKNIQNIDLSANVIKFMKERNKAKEMSWEVMDARDLKFNSNFFDLIVDKSTLDTVMCGESANLNCAMMLKEVQRVLKVGGIYLIISYGDPDSRMPHLSQEHLAFDISVHTLKKNFSVALRDEEENNVINLNSPRNVEKTHYVYLCKKKPGADIISQENFPSVYLDLEKGDMIEEDEEFFSFEANSVI